MKHSNLFIVLLLLALGVGGGIYIDRSILLSTDNSQTALEHAQKHLDPEYVCPMHPEILSSDADASCPICGMDLVAIKQSDTGDSDDEYPVVRVPSTMINNMGVRVALAERKTLVRQIETPGFIQRMAKDKFSRFTAPAKGHVTKFYSEPGEWIKKGEPLVDIELDDLVLVQEKHLQLLDAKKAEETVPSDTDSPEPTLEKTRLLMKAAGMTDEQVKHLELSKETSPLITLYARHDGEIKDLRVAVGDKVKARTLLFTFGGLMRVTVLANAFQRDASWVKAGQDVDIILPHDSEKVWKGKVSSGAVTINTNSQNIGVKLVFVAPDSVVKSGMYVVGNIYGQVRDDALAIPREAVIYSRNEKRVIVALGRGRFKPVVVDTGISNDREVEILRGLEDGDTVVVSAQFLIDSESSLQASYRRMTGVEP